MSQIEEGQQSSGIPRDAFLERELTRMDEGRLVFDDPAATLLAVGMFRDAGIEVPEAQMERVLAHLKPFGVALNAIQEDRSVSFRKFI